MALAFTKAQLKKLRKDIAAAVEAEDDLDEVFDAFEASGKAPGKTRKAKKVVDKDMVEAIGPAPKRAPSGYILFGNSIRARVKKENPDAGFGEITKLISEEWNALSAKQKKPWNEKSATAKSKQDKVIAAYKKKVEEYKAGSGGESGDSDAESEEKPAKKAKGKAKGKSKKAAESEEEPEASEPEEVEEEKPAKKGKASKGKSKKAAESEEDAEPEEVEEEPEAVDYSKMKLPELKALAKERGVDIKGKTKKDDIVAALQEADGGEEVEEE